MRKNKVYSGKYNYAFYRLRADRCWSQEELATRLGYTRQYIAQVENGSSYGKTEFWKDVQNYFNIPDDKMWTLISGCGSASVKAPVHFLCDQKKCKNCKSDICIHTCDVTHAKNFEYDGYCGYWEKKI